MTQIPNTKFASIPQLADNPVIFISQQQENIKQHQAINMCGKLLDILLHLYNLQIHHGDLHYKNMLYDNNGNLQIFGWGHLVLSDNFNAKALKDLVYVLNGGDKKRKTQNELMRKSIRSLPDIKSFTKIKQGLVDKLEKHNPLEKFLRAGGVDEEQITGFLTQCATAYATIERATASQHTEVITAQINRLKDILNNMPGNSVTL